MGDLGQIAGVRLVTLGDGKEQGVCATASLGSIEGLRLREPVVASWEAAHRVIRRSLDESRHGLARFGGCVARGWLPSNSVRFAGIAGAVLGSVVTGSVSQEFGLYLEPGQGFLRLLEPLKILRGLQHGDRLLC